MKKNHFLITAIVITTSVTGAFAQQITGPSLYSPVGGGARILSAQGNTAANPAIGFQSNVSSTTTAENDGGGGNGIFRPEANVMAFATGSLERMRISSGGQISIGTTTPTAQFEVTTTMMNNPAISANGKSVGVYAEATAQQSSLIKRSNLYGDLDGIAVFGNAKYTTASVNGSMYGIVGSATELNPLNNVGVFGEAKNATGYNHGIVGYVNSSTGYYNAGVSSFVGLNTSATYNRAIWGEAPVANNHYAGFFNGNVDIKSGVVTIGDGTLCTPAGYKLFVEQGILTEKVKVAINCSSAWADYVFANDYKLKPLSEVEAYIKENKHLPNIPSASELVSEGLNLGEMQAKQMEKIEELTLYMIEMKKEIDTLKKENQSLKILVEKPKN